MTKSLSTAGLCLFVASLLCSAHADVITGRILCDANKNMTADAGDAGVAGALVVIVSEAGGSSNAAITAADGSFSMTIPNFNASAYRQDPLSQSYIETVSASTLPADATVVFPQPALGTTPAYYIAPASTNSPLMYISAAGVSSTGDWLISSSACQGIMQSNACRVAGSGLIKGASNRVEHSFSGSVSPTVKKNGFRQGNWTHEARALKLRFRSTAIDAVSCAEGTDGVSEVNAIEFSGRGILHNRNGRKTVSTPVFFTAWAEDHGTPGAGKDGYYIRVYDAQGVTLILVSGDPANPENIVPVPISRGNFRVRPAQF
jgi:hypothetical protein